MLQHLHLYDTVSDLNQDYVGNGENYVEPGVSLVINTGDVNYNMKDPTNGVEYVDFGLPSGKLGATKNLGQTDTNQLGVRFAGGETETKDSFSNSTYKFGSSAPYSKYNDFNSVLELEDDAANVLLGGKWHIPSMADFQELSENTIKSRVTYGTYSDCLKFTSTTDSSKYIILPPGSRTYNGTTTPSPSTVYYGSNTSHGSDRRYAMQMYEHSGAFISTYGQKAGGLLIRPVCEVR